VVPDPLRLVDEVRSRSPSAGSCLHGERHWQAVGLAGVELAEEVPGADPELVFLFALFHDAMRLNDDHDPGHGARGAGLAGELHEESFRLDGDRFALLVEACAGHTDGGLATEPAVGVCWDADRLNLWRVGRQPDPALLSTEPARRPELIEAARAYHGNGPSWETLAGRLCGG